MKVLVFNPGSSSLKFDVVEGGPHAGDFVRGRKLVSGVVEPIGGPATLSVKKGRSTNPGEDLLVPDHGVAAQKVLARMNAGVIGAAGFRRIGDIDAVGFRVVHGGERYRSPVRIDDEVVSSIEELEELAPLHNAGSVSVIRASRALLPQRLPLVGVFDTAFHQTIPRRAHLYAIPWDLATRHKIRRYGFHGISHNYLLLRFAELTHTPVDQTNIISLHLEGGSSATAIEHGRSIDTSMGFTPLEGLVMGTRSGDVDPAIIPFLARKERVDTDTVEEWLNKRSGLLGISGISQDTRVLVRHAAQEERARLALELFSYRVKKYIGAYLAAIGGAAAIVFGGGIGENTPDVRRAICEGLDCFGLKFDVERNAEVIDREGVITRDDSELQAWVIPSEEGLMIAHETMRCCLEQGIIAA